MTSVLELSYSVEALHALLFMSILTLLVDT